MITIPAGTYYNKKQQGATIYAALTGGTTQIAKSTDLGDTWQAQAVTLNGNPTCFAKDDAGNIYVGTDSGWVYKNWIGVLIGSRARISSLNCINNYLYIAIKEGDVS